jgi:excisionase family DNA binding protein
LSIDHLSVEIRRNASEKVTDSVTPIYLTCAEAAQLIGINVKTLQRWALTSSMPVLRHGRILRFHSERLLRWLEVQEQPAHRRRKAQPMRSN